MRLVRLWVGVVLLVLGLLGLLDALGALDAGSTVGRWWPLAVVGLGVVGMVSQRRISVGPAVVTVVGLVLLVDRLGWTESDLLGPALLVLAGVLVLSGLGRRWYSDHRGLNISEPVAIFGGVEVKDRSAHFTRADVSAVFGGATLDLRGAHIDDEATVNAFALFGGAELLVPKEWRVSVNGLPIFGAFEDKTKGDGALPAEAPLLKVNGTALFGGVEVANEPK